MRAWTWILLCIVALLMFFNTCVHLWNGHYIRGLRVQAEENESNWQKSADRLLAVESRYDEIDSMGDRQFGISSDLVLIRKAIDDLKRSLEENQQAVTEHKKLFTSNDDTSSVQQPPANEAP